MATGHLQLLSPRYGPVQKREQASVDLVKHSEWTIVSGWRDTCLPEQCGMLGAREITICLAIFFLQLEASSVKKNPGPKDSHPLPPRKRLNATRATFCLSRLLSLKVWAMVILIKGLWRWVDTVWIWAWKCFSSPLTTLHLMRSCLGTEFHLRLLRGKWHWESHLLCASVSLGGKCRVTTKFPTHNLKLFKLLIHPFHH